MTETHDEVRPARGIHSIRSWTPLLQDLLELDRAGALDGICAVIQARLALARGQVPMPEGDLVTASMMLQAAEGITPRLERLVLATALLAAEIDRQQENQSRTVS